VNDLVRAHILAYEKFGEQAIYKEYNVGTGSGKSVFQVIDTIEKTLHEKVAMRVIERRE
jgi:UDP-glucose 4-epimerase